jgi:hypothetical protein
MTTKTKDRLTTFFACLTIILCIGAAGAIDGPVGYEKDNWLLCGILFLLSIVSGILCIFFQETNRWTLIYLKAHTKVRTQ